MSINELQEYLSVIKDTLGIVSSIVLTIIAILGLRAWKIQLKGKTEYDLARRLLMSTYKVRDAICYVRNPFASAAEIAISLEESSVDTKFGEPDYDSQSQNALYQRRWKLVQEALTELDSNAFEAEVVWGNEIREVITAFQKQVQKLYININRYLRELADPRDYDPERMNEIDDIVYGSHRLNNADTDNVYSRETYLTIKAIEDFIRPKMK